MNVYNTDKIRQYPVFCSISLNLDTRNGQKGKAEALFSYICNELKHYLL